MKKMLCLALGFWYVSCLSAQCPVVPVCPPDGTIYPDTTTNHTWFWHTPPFTWDSLHQQGNLAEAPVPAVCLWPDTCGMGNIQAHFILSLDLNDDDVPETRISSLDTLPNGTFVFNNLFGGTDTLTFDLRPIFQRYRFEVLTERIGDSLQFKLVWVSSIDTVPAQLPLGAHQLEWRILEGGVTDTCRYGFQILDNTSPVVTCGPQLNTNIPVSGKLHLWASDFLQTLDDNITPPNLLQIAVRKKNTNGTGFPLDTMGNPVTYVEYSCNEAGLTPVEHCVELWTKDRSGNTSFCEAKITVGLAVWDCNIDFTKLFVCPLTEDGDFIGNVEHTVDGTNSFIGHFHHVLLKEEAWCALFNGVVPLYSDFQITSSRIDNILNGVTTYDLVLMSKHILALTPLTSPYKIIAADANKSGSITTFDILSLRKLILGIDTALTNNTSWMFIPDTYVFPDSLNPFSPAYPTVAFVDNWSGSASGHDFIGVKVGDVNGSAIPDFQTNPVSESREIQLITARVPMLTDGNQISQSIEVTQSGAWNGFQLALQYDPALLAVNSVTSAVLPDFNEQNWSVPAPGELRISWSAAEAIDLSAGQQLFSIHGKFVGNTQTGSLFTQMYLPGWSSEMYHGAGETFELQLGTDMKNLDGMQVFAVQPNPCSDQAYVPIHLPNEGVVQLEVWDISGKCTGVINQTYKTGAHLLEIPSAFLPDSGCYWWRLSTNRQSVSGKLVKE